MSRREQTTTVTWQPAGIRHTYTEHKWFLLKSECVRVYRRRSVCGIGLADLWRRRHSFITHTLIAAAPKKKWTAAQSGAGNEPGRINRNGLGIGSHRARYGRAAPSSVVSFNSHGDEMRINKLFHLCRRRFQGWQHEKYVSWKIGSAHLFEISSSGPYWIWPFAVFFFFCCCCILWYD